MNIFQVKCDEQGVDIDLLKGNRIELVNADKYVRNIVNELKSDGERNKNIILELQEEVRENNEKIGKLNEKLQEMKSMIEKESKSMIEKEFAKLKLDGEKNKKSIGALEKKFEQKNEQIQNKFVNATKKRENKEEDFMRNIDQMKNKQTKMTTMSNKIDQTMKNVENKLLKKEINQNKMRNGEFVWIIDKINDKIKDTKNGINTAIYSDSFYTHKHGYKMCLSVYPNGHRYYKIDFDVNLYVGFHLMRGEFDDILQWPFKYEVTLSLINQQTGLAHVSETVKYWPHYASFNKPINERNLGLGFYIMKLKELSTDANLMRNNQIVIKCSVNIPS